MDNGCGRSADFIIIGGGMAGVSAGYFLARDADVILLEREQSLAYHTTGRSAAIFTEAYGNDVIRRLTVGGRAFFESPPDGFTEHPLLTPRGALFVGRPDQSDSLSFALEDGQRYVASVCSLSADEACELIPALRPEYLHAAVYEPDAMALDVDLIHRGFVSGMRRHGAAILTDHEVLSVSRSNARTTVRTKHGDFDAAVVINAAGAWCDIIGSMHGAEAIGLVPKRRTAFIFRPTGVRDGHVVDWTDATSVWPLCIDVDEQFYFKPEAGLLMGSLADETPSQPCDAQPEEYDIALAADRIQRATFFDIRRIEHKWAGLRSFVADKTPVVGFDDGIEGLFWLAGQGGYGIQTAPGLGRVAAAVATGSELPTDLAKLGVTAQSLAPSRLR
jgi:D-arginine dehydrogenase